MDQTKHVLIDIGMRFQNIEFKNLQAVGLYTFTSDGSCIWWSLRIIMWIPFLAWQLEKSPVILSVEKS